MFIRLINIRLQKKKKLSKKTLILHVNVGFCECDTVKRQSLHFLQSCNKMGKVTKA